MSCRAPALTLCILLILLCFAGSSRAGFTLEQYNSWQIYNGWLIQVIEFPGIASFARQDLLEVMATEKPAWLRRYVRLGSRTTFWTESFASDILRVENFYHREGFPHAVVRGFVYEREKHEELRLKVEIEEGPSLILERWYITMGSDSGAGVDSARWSRLLPIQIGKRLSQTDIRTAADTLRYRLQEIGHARARVEHTLQIDSLNNTAVLEFILYPGPFCRIGVTHIRGLKQVSEQTARRELTYHENEPYAPSKLAATRRRLLRLETFRMVRTDIDLTQPSDTLTVTIRTEEGNRYKLRTGGGYDTEERSHVQTEFTDLNFFGRARRFSTLVRISEINRKVEGRLFWPHTPWNATDITLIPAWKLETRPGFAVEQKTNTSILSAEPLENVTTSISNEVGRETVRDSIETTVSIETASIAWDTRDNPLIPRQGHVLSFSTSESGAFYGTTNRWWRVHFHARALVPIDKFTTFATKTETGLMGPLHNSKLTPVNERFYLGGGSTVRGWGQDKLSPRDPDTGKPVGGDFTYHLTGEIRRDVWGPVGLILFFDAGNVWDDFAGADLLDLYTASGLGIRFLTPVGPIRVDFGYQLRPNPYGENRLAFHLSLGSPF